ncbi:heterokaryon incompatibility protein-domain-containing protein [Nemania sp. FL0916]|nr:heterokaryon incompatibility protein-domain-containing protein [Nemania sp. FL0916]
MNDVAAGDLAINREGELQDVPEAILCHICAPIFDQYSYERWSKFRQLWEKVILDGPAFVTRPSPWRHHQSQQSLQDSVNQGCFICSRLGTCVGDVSPSFPLMYSVHLQLKTISPQNLVSSYILEIGKFSFEIKPASPGTTVEGIRGRSMCRVSTGHEDVAMLARAWLSECIHEHEACSKSFASGWKPTRLLDVSEDKIKLVLGQSVGADEAYVTLSHCWGTRKFSVLTAEVLPRYLEGVYISDWEPTFRETIITVRRLGFRYLWIDCYCILQGSGSEAKVDWEYESSRMGKVYANSILNIGALDSVSPAHGLFRNRSPQAVSGRIPWAPTQKEGCNSFYLRRVPFQLDKSPLLRRGWVIQECVLTPRMLSFGKSEVLWQCSTQLNSGVSAKGKVISSSEFFQGILSRYPFWVLGNAAAPNPPRILEIGSRWFAALASYSNSHLSYPEKDLFRALDGIGEEFSKISGGSFKYGMLSSTLPEGLMFVPDQSLGLQFKRNDKRPTWHWASSYPGLSRNYGDLIYAERSEDNRLFFRMAYAFMSDNCKPLPDERSKDFWPNMLLIGRLTTERPKSCSYDSEADRDNSSSRPIYYLALINVQSKIEGKLSSSLQGIMLVQLESGAYRRIGRWRNQGWNDEFNAKVFKARPQLIVLE